MLKIAICDDDLGFTGSLETMHNNSFGVWKQETYRYDKLAFILCISGDNGG